MLALGFEPLLATDIQSPIITSFKYPDANFDFRKFYEALKQAGFIIYPDDIQRLLQVIGKTEGVQPVAVNG